MPNEPTFDLFVSCADADRPWVNGYLLNAMDQAGVRYQSEDDFRLGAPEVTEFERLIQQSKHTLLVVSPEYLADEFVEYGQVLAQSFGVDKGKWPVIPVTREAVEMPTRLEMLAGLDFTDENKPNWSDELERLVKNVKDKVPNLDPGKPPPCPYPGMVPFTEKDWERFYGREDDVEAARQCLLDHTFLTVIGPSGSGKSSLVFAGLIPALRESKSFGAGTWLIKSMRPGETPLLTLSSTLGTDLASPQELVAAVLKTRRGAKRLLLVIDQFEESFTVARAEEVAPFHGALGELAKVPGFFLVLTVRADFYSELMISPLWSEIRAHRLEVLPLDEHGLREAITKPAEEAKVKVYVEGALVERLVTDAAGEPGVLPLMQETLRLLWTKLDRRFLSLDAYEALVRSSNSRGTGGAHPRTGLQVAMARRADWALGQLSAEQRTIARRIFLRLIQFGEGRADTRRQQSETALRAAGEDARLFDATLHQLVAARLLTVSSEQDARPANGRIFEPERRVDIAHEALIGGWPQLQEWLSERREAEQARRRLEAKSEEWVRLGRGQGGLLDAAELAEAEHWLDSTDAFDLGTSDTMPALIRASQTALGKELRRLRIQRGVAFGLLGLAILIGVLVYWLYQNAQRQAELNRIQALSAAADNHLDLGTNELGLLLALQAYRFEQQLQDSVSLEVDAALRRVMREPQIRRDLRGHASAINALAFSPTSRQFASSDDTGGVLLRDLDRPDAEPIRLGDFGENERVLAVAISPGGDKLAAGSDDDGTVSIFDLHAPGETILDPHGDAAAVTALVFVSDQLLASAHANGIIRLWNVEDPDAQPRLLVGGEGPVNELDFAPGSNKLASAQENGIIHLWELDSCLLELDLCGIKVTTLKGHERAVLSVSLNPSGDRVASGDAGGGVLVWDINHPGYADKISSNLLGRVNEVAFSPKGDMLAAAGEIGSIWIWDANALDDEPQSIEINPRLPPEIRSLAFASQGDVLAAAGVDQIIHLWHLGDDFATPQVLRGAGGGINALVFIQSEQALISGGVGVDGGAVKRWNAADPGTAPQALPGNPGIVEALAYYPAGNRLATGADGGPVLVWDLSNPGSNPWQLTLPEGEFTSAGLAFSPAGDQLASASSDGLVWLWDLNRRTAAPEPLQGHENWVGAIAFDREGHWLVSGGQDGRLLLWDLNAPARPNQELGDHGAQIRAVAFAPNRDLVASAGADGTIRLWDANQPGADPETMVETGSTILALDFSPVGDRLASASADGTIRLWNPDQPEDSPIVLGSHDDEAPTVAFAPNGRTLASGSLDGTIQIWFAETSDLAERVCQRVFRNLSQNEWDRFVGADVGYEPACPDLP